jgi:hypothetical protein
MSRADRGLLRPLPRDDLVIGKDVLDDTVIGKLARNEVKNLHLIAPRLPLDDLSYGFIGL